MPLVGISKYPCSAIAIDGSVFSGFVFDALTSPTFRPSRFLITFPATANVQVSITQLPAGKLSINLTNFFKVKKASVALI